MLRVGLTGGIACGKSLIGRLFEERHVPVIDDDVAARDAVSPGSEGLADVVAEFGEGILAPDGSLDRPALGKIVFADDGLRRRLMAITHPRIGALIAERFRAAEASVAPFVVYESALLIENGNVDAWRPLVVVRTDRETQIERMAGRNGLSREEAEDRIRSQMPVEEKAALADFVIDNSSTTQHAANEFERVYAAVVERASAD
ncbi:MAG: dephospho-CoA kinase [Candidatus Binatia bacterium]|nr:dephospho-CoA kinase [Candidatus Binatia bacterium]